MILRSFAAIALIAVVLISGGCSSLPDRQDRIANLTYFNDRPERYALYIPASLRSEEQLRILGVKNAGETLSQQFYLQDPMVGVIEQFLAANLGLAEGPIHIVHPKEARSLPVTLHEPVLFFYSSWELLYRRLPPTPQMNRLRVGVRVKVIPLGQVLEGKGTIALRTASWEGTCSLEVFDGEFLHLDEWGANDGEKLHQGIDAAQIYCGEKLGSEFSAAIVSAGLTPSN